MSGKRYAIVCAACDRLADVARSDAICCSPGCRVTLHRHPELRDRGHVTHDIPLTFLLQTAAYARLYPDRVDAVINGDLNLGHPTRKDILNDQARHDAIRALDALIAEILTLPAALPGAAGTAQDAEHQA